jgi:hypothetical protein
MHSILEVRLRALVGEEIELTLGYRLPHYTAVDHCCNRSTWQLMSHV